MSGFNNFPSFCLEVSELLLIFAGRNQIVAYKSVMEVSSYRPRNPGHDYYGQGTYLITLVVNGRESLLSRFVTNVSNENPAGVNVLCSHRLVRPCKRHGSRYLPDSRYTAIT